MEPVSVPETKKAIVVVGKMGHGKSAFVKMLACQIDKLKIKAETSTKSVTTECSLYQVDPSFNLYPEDLYIIDTPGLDSDEAAFFVVEKLNQFVIEKSLQIVSILYILNIKAGRQNTGNGKNFIVTFFNNMRLRRSIKKNIMCIILTRFDQHYRQPQAIEKLSDQYVEDFDEEGLLIIWHKKIEWMSQPQEDPQQFQQIKKDQNHPAHTIWVNQWKKLKKNMSVGKYQSLAQYKGDVQKFRQTIQKKMCYILKENKGTKHQYFPRQMTVQKNLNWWSLLTWSGFYNTVVVGSYAAMRTTIVEAIGGSAVVATGGATAATVAAPIVAVVGTALGLGFIIFGLAQAAVDLIVSQSVDNRWRLQHMPMIWTEIKQFQIKHLNESTKVDKKAITVLNSEWISNVQGFITDNQGNRRDLKFIKKSLQTEAEVICSGKLNLKYQVKTPTNEAYAQFAKRVSTEYYGQL